MFSSDSGCWDGLWKQIPSVTGIEMLSGLADPRSLQVKSCRIEEDLRQEWDIWHAVVLLLCTAALKTRRRCHLTLHPRHKCRWPEEGVQQSSGWLALESLEKYDLICDASKLRREVTRFLRRVNITQFVTLITCAWDGWLLVQQNTRRDGFIMCYWQQACWQRSTPWISMDLHGEIRHWSCDIVANELQVFNAGMTCSCNHFCLGRQHLPICPSIRGFVQEWGILIPQIYRCCSCFFHHISMQTGHLES